MQGIGQELDRWASQLRKGALALGVLLLLQERRRYGLELVEELERRTGLTISEGTIYPLLSRLHREGLVEAEWDTRTSGHPRKYYRLTAKGRAYLGEMVTRWRLFVQGVNALLDEREEARHGGCERARERERNREHEREQRREAEPRGAAAARRLPEAA